MSADTYPDYRKKLARALFEASYGKTLIAWSEETERHWLARADAALHPAATGSVRETEAGWSFNPDTRDIECGNAPVFRVYEADDFPCIEEEERAKEDEWFDAQAQTAVLMLNSLLHANGDSAAAPTPDAAASGLDEEYMSVSISRDGVVTSHNAYDANFDEMITATQAIITALQQRLGGRLKCPFAAGRALLGNHPLDNPAAPDAATIDVEAIFEWVSSRSHPSIATAWTCGLAATTLAWMLRLARYTPIVMTDTIEGSGHMWVEMDERYYDPTIGQFGDFAGTGPLPHPLSSRPSPAAASEHDGLPCETCQGNGEVVTDWDRYTHAKSGDVGDEAVADCPDCDGTGRVAAASEAGELGDPDSPCTDCDDTGMTFQTERPCSCGAGEQFRTALTTQGGAEG